MSRRVLAFAYDAGRQGAPRVMLDMLTWFREHSDLEFQVVLHMGGPLINDFRRVAATGVLNPFLGSPRLAAKIARTLIPKTDNLDRLLAQRHVRRVRDSRFDVVWMNSVASWRVADIIAPVGVPRVLHVHELANVIRLVGPSQRSFAKMAGHFVAASGAVRDNLVDHHEVRKKDITVVYSAVSPSSAQPLDPSTHSDRRARLGIGPGDLVLVACGAGEPAKGFDLVPSLLSMLRRRKDLPPTHLVWVGRVDDPLPSSIWVDLERLGVADALHLTGEVEDPRQFFSLADVFVLPSREEALGIVCLEAAQCCIPTVCFADAGGAPEFVGNDAGRVVPYLDVIAFANAVSEIARDPKLRIKLGKRAKQKVESRFNIEYQAPLLLDVLTKAAKTRP